VVDDDPLVLSGTVAMLEDAGHVVTAAASGSEALGILGSPASFDVVLSDHAMPNMSGVELARRIRQRWPGMPIVLASGYVDLCSVGDLDLPRLAKPYTQMELVEVISSASN
jgi:CheY-like chemotaxis protein